MSLIVTGSIGIDTIHAPAGIAENVLGGSCICFPLHSNKFDRGIPIPRPIHLRCSV